MRTPEELVKEYLGTDFAVRTWIPDESEYVRKAFLAGYKAALESERVMGLVEALNDAKDGRLLHGLTVIDFLRSKHMAGWELDAGMRSGDCKLIAEKIVEELEDKSPSRTVKEKPE